MVECWNIIQDFRISCSSVRHWSHHP